MRRTDRLFEIIQVLRSARIALRAASIAELLEVSTRTIYRDIATLQAMRVPISGEAGVGYMMQSGYDLPPLNFDMEELEAIIVGLSLLARTGDTKLQSAANRVRSKIDLNRNPIDRLRVSDWGVCLPEHIHLDDFRQAIRNEQKLRINYRDGENVRSERTICPIAMIYYIEVVVLTAWCELRGDFRSFRVDRICSFHLTGGNFKGRGANLRRQLDAQQITLSANP